MPMSGLKLRFSIAMARLGRSVVAMVFLVMAIVLFSAAGWIALADWRGALFATLTLGGISLALAVVFFVMARLAGYRLAAATPPPAPQRSVDGAALLEAFVAGVVAGMKRGSAGRRE